MTPPVIDPVWSPILALLASLLAYSLRKFTPTASWLHTGLGAFAILVTCTGLDAVAEAIRAGGLHAASLVPAVCSAIGSLIAVANPSVRAGGAALLPLLFFAAAAASGCATTSGQAWKQCEIDKLPQTGQTALATATQVALDPSSTVDSLETAALAFLPGQFECAMRALVALWAKSSERGAVSPLMRHAQSVAQEYLAKHQTAACGAPRRVVGELGDDVKVGICDSTTEEGAAACRLITIDGYSISSSSSSFVHPRSSMSFGSSESPSAGGTYALPSRSIWRSRIDCPTLCPSFSFSNRGSSATSRAAGSVDGSRNATATG